MDDLEYHFKLIWGKPFQGKRSPQSEHDLKFRKKMAQLPLEERIKISDEDMIKLELENHYSFKDK